MVTYPIQWNDILICDINSYLTGAFTPNGADTGISVVIPTNSGYSGGLCFNFKAGSSVQKQLDKTVYTYRKPGIPVGFEIGLGERIFNVLGTIKKSQSLYVSSSSAIFQSLTELNYLANYQYNKMRTINDAGGAITATPAYGILNFFYIGDRVQFTFYKVLVKNLWYDTIEGGDGLTNIRISLTEVSPP